MFGPGLPFEGYEAYLIPIEFLDDTEDTHGCHPINLSSAHYQHFWDLVGKPGVPWIALVERGQCSFVDKVRAMQASGASAVIVGDNVPGGPLKRMTADMDAAADIKIPSSFVMQWEYKDLKLEAMKKYSGFLKTKTMTVEVREGKAPVWT